MNVAAKILVPILTGSATASFASTSSLDLGGSGMLIWFFIGFAAMVVLFQTAPALVLFAAMLKGMFSSNPAEAAFSPFKGKVKK